MKFATKRQIYESMPLFLKRSTGLISFPLLAGRAYKTTFGRNQLFDCASRDDVLGYQERALGKILSFATTQVPAYHPYRDIVERHKPFEALKAFPLIDKETVQKQLPNFLSIDIDRIPHYEVTTGGTSGNQLKIFLDDESHAIETAFMHRQWARVGYTPWARKAVFRGAASRSFQMASSGSTTLSIESCSSLLLP